jgi:16S rRNA (uracil1498-N3)-methyltransferase
MKIHRFFVKQIIEKDEDLIITDVDVIHQIKNVLRLQKDETVVLLDGSGKEFFAKVKIILKSESIFSKIKIKSNPQDIHKLNLYFSIPKKDKSEWVLQKGTELGVNNFIPIISERTEKINLKQERAEIIIKEAAEQSEKSFLPTFHNPVKLRDVIQGLNPLETFYLDIEADKLDLKKLKNMTSLNIFVGPEGGWSDKDKEIFSKYNIKSYSLGNFVLRAETASIAIVSVLKIN